MNPNWKEKLSYRFDNLMSRGTIALISGLGVVSLALILLVATVVAVAGIAPGDGNKIGFWEAAWLSLMRTLDAGTMGGDTGWSFRIAMFVVTLGGVFVISLLIGVLTSGIENKLDELRKGRSRVIEAGHTVILGWSSQVFTILSELAVANENQKNACVVILGDRDKVEMEDAIRTVLGSPKHMRIVVRNGNRLDARDLALVNLAQARSIIILPVEGSDPDAQTIKTILAITNSLERRPEPYHIVAEIKDPKNYEVARIVGKDEAELVLTGDLISRIIAQTCRQSGLSVVYTELLDFENDEIYFKEEPVLLGKTFKEALFAYRKSGVMGIWRKGAGVKLNPPMDTRLAEGDQIIAISADDDTILLDKGKNWNIQEEEIALSSSQPLRPERTLVLGWNWRAPSIINELDHYVAPGSSVTLIADYAEGEADIAYFCPDLANQTVIYQKADTTDRRVLEAARPEDYNHVVVLSDSDTKEVQEADACTLMTLLHLRDMAERNQTRIPIVSEMLDVHNRVLAEVTHADDFIVSEKIISLVMTQVSENKELNQVFTDLFDPEGSEIYLKPASQYVRLGRPVSFYTVVESAARCGEVAIGYRIQAHSDDEKKGYGVVVNPDKLEMITFCEGDRVVVLAEN